jgi:hypothetical protein
VKNEKPCKKCGHCPTCGRSAQPYFAWWSVIPPYTLPYVPYPQTGSPLPRPYYTSTSGSATSANPPGGIAYNA